MSAHWMAGRASGRPASQPRQSQCHQHAERQVHAHHRAAGHPRDLDERHEARECLRQRQSSVEPSYRQERTQRPDRKHDEDDLPPARLFCYRATCLVRSTARPQGRFRASPPLRCGRGRDIHRTYSPRGRTTDETDCRRAVRARRHREAHCARNMSGSRSGRTTRAEMPER